MTKRKTLVIRLIPTLVALALAAGWTAREFAFAHQRAEFVASKTITLDQVAMEDYEDDGQPAGQVGVYLAGETPASTKFVTGRFVLPPGKSPHPPHQHPEEEVMIIESGNGEIVCDGKTTQIGPGSVMYTAPDVPHGIVNTGNEPIVFYFIKWEAKGQQ